MGRNLKTVLLVLVLLAASAAIAYLFMGMKKEPEKGMVKAQKRYVKAVPVEYSTVRNEIEVSGRLLSSETYNLAAEVQGRILEGAVPLKKGQKFSKGDLLFRIYDDDVEQALHASKSRFLTSLANILPDFKIDFPESFDKWNDFFMAVDIKKPLPELPAISDRKEKTFLASRNILSDYYSITGEEIRMKKYQVFAPFNGSYTDVVLEVGAIANPGSKIAGIIRTDIYELEVPVEIDNAESVNKGEQIIVMNENRTQNWPGTLVRKADFVDPNTQSIPVFIRISPRSAAPLYEGQYLRAVFPGQDIENSMEIPRNSVFNHDEVFIVDDGRLTKKRIDIKQVNNETVVFSGLPEGTLIVVEPLVSASEGIAVEVI